MGNHGGLPCESIYGSFADVDELKNLIFELIVIDKICSKHTQILISIF
jgi:hypothetical protein